MVFCWPRCATGRNEQKHAEDAGHAELAAERRIVPFRVALDAGGKRGPHSFAR
jgi:hypothetical protein